MGSAKYTIQKSDDGVGKREALRLHATKLLHHRLKTMSRSEAISCVANCREASTSKRKRKRRKTTHCDQTTIEAKACEHQAKSEERSTEKCGRSESSCHNQSEKEWQKLQDEKEVRREGGGEILEAGVGQIPGCQPGTIRALASLLRHVRVISGSRQSRSSIRKDTVFTTATESGAVHASADRSLNPKNLAPDIDRQAPTSWYDVARSDSNIESRVRTSQW